MFLVGALRMFFSLHNWNGPIFRVAKLLCFCVCVCVCNCLWDCLPCRSHPHFHCQFQTKYAWLPDAENMNGNWKHRAAKAKTRKSPFSGKMSPTSVSHTRECVRNVNWNAKRMKRRRKKNDTLANVNWWFHTLAAMAQTKLSMTKTTTTTTFYSS